MSSSSGFGGLGGVGMSTSTSAPPSLYLGRDTRGVEPIAAARHGMLRFVLALPASSAVASVGADRDERAAFSAHLLTHGYSFVRHATDIVSYRIVSYRIPTGLVGAACAGSAAPRRRQGRVIRNGQKVTV